MVSASEAEERRVSVRRLGSRAQSGMGLDEALELLADEATAPYVRRARGGDVRLAAE